MPSDPGAVRRWLDDIHHHIVLAQTFVEGMTYDALRADLRTTYAVTRCLEIISEASRRLPDDTWAGATTPHGRLMLTVLGGLAEFERELIRARTSEGRARAKARGVRLGRKPKLTAHQQKEAIKRRNAGEAVREIARSYNVSHSTISRLPFWE